MAREIESVVFVSLGRGEMRMSCSPRDFGREVIGCARHFADLQPSENDVKVRRIADEAERASKLLGTSKASEEEEQVAGAHLLVREMALGGRGLAEDWAPSRGTRERVAPQIRIEMSAVASADSAARQVFDNLRDLRPVER